MSERRRDAGMGILIVSHLLAERERLDRMYELLRREDCGASERLRRRRRRFMREHLRAPLTLVLLVAIPVFFVLIFASVLGDFAEALGGDARRAGRDLDQRRLGGGLPLRDARLLPGQLLARGRPAPGAAPGSAPWRVAIARIAAALALGVIVSAVAFLTLWLRSGIEHPAARRGRDPRLRLHLHRHRRR